MFSVRPRFKLIFFDRSVIRTNWKKINDRPLRRAGALVRKIARQSIRRVPYGKKRSGLRYSRPGSPPWSRSGKRGAAPFKLIFNLPYGPMGLTEIIGMVGFGTGFGTPVPGLHEHGGVARRKVFDRNSIQARMSKKQRPRWRSVYYPERPFMLPALKKARTLPQFWKNSLSR